MEAYRVVGCRGTNVFSRIDSQMAGGLLALRAGSAFVPERSLIHFC
jgi:hypothetical protein